MKKKITLVRPGRPIKEVEILSWPIQPNSRAGEAQALVATVTARLVEWDAELKTATRAPASGGGKPRRKSTGKETDSLSGYATWLMKSKKSCGGNKAGIYPMTKER